MTVQEFIDLLQTVPNKNLPIYAYLCEDVDIEDPNDIQSIDCTISDRVDLNISSIGSYPGFPEIITINN